MGRRRSRGIYERDTASSTDATAARLTRGYGTRAAAMLGDSRVPADLGRDFGHSLTEREVTWLVEHEWARSAGEDILWRRSKLGLRLSGEQAAALGDFLIEAQPRRLMTSEAAPG